MILPNDTSVDAHFAGCDANAHAGRLQSGVGRAGGANTFFNHQVNIRLVFLTPTPHCQGARRAMRLGRAHDDVIGRDADLRLNPGADEADISIVQTDDIEAEQRRALSIPLENQGREIKPISHGFSPSLWIRKPH